MTEWRRLTRTAGLAAPRVAAARRGRWCVPGARTIPAAHPIGRAGDRYELGVVVAFGPWAESSSVLRTSFHWNFPLPRIQ